MPRTILIVEDTEAGRDVLEMALLQLPGIAVRSVATAEEALACLAWVSRVRCGTIPMIRSISINCPR